MCAETLPDWWSECRMKYIRRFFYNTRIMSQAGRKARAKDRRGTTVLHKTRLQAVEHDLSPIDGAEALSLVSRLTIESWSLAGRSMPTYDRAETPCRFVASSIT